MLLKKHLTLLLAGTAPSLASAASNTIKGAEVDKCITCVTSNNANFSFSWTDGTCSDDSTCGDSSNPGAGPRCCVDDGCCSEDGCRSPDDTSASFASCSQCCDEVSSGDGGVDCIVRFWSDVGSDGVTLLAPWYNDETYQTGGCDDPTCPPCAVCSSRDEMELTTLASGRSAGLVCTAQDCEERRYVNYFVDPCQFNSPSDDCDCFCWLANPLLDDCPHLSDGVFNPLPVQDPAQDPVQQDPVQEDAPPQDQGDAGDASSGGGGSGVDDTPFGDVPEGEKQVARTSGTSDAAPTATGSFGSTMLVVGCALAGTIQLLVLS